MTLLTVVIAVAMLVAALGGRYWIALSVGGGTPIGAALLAGGIGVPTFYAACAGALAGLVLRALRNWDAPSTSAPPLFQGAVPLLLFGLWAIGLTLAAPMLFYGTVVFLGPDPNSRSTVPAVLTTSNVAQIGYLVLALAAVFFLAGSRNLGPGVVGLAAGLVTVLSFWRYLHQIAGLPFPEGVFDSNTTYDFIETLPGGAPRFRGILSEPAGLAVSSIVTIAYALSRATHVQGVRRVWMLLLAAMAAVMALNSTSATFVVVIALVALVAAIAFFHRLLTRDGKRKTRAVLLLLTAVLVSLYALPLVVASLQEVVADKVGTSSFSDRTLSDNRSYQIVVEKFGLGVGIGSNRSSSFLAFLLSTTGVIGVVLFAWAVAVLIRGAIRSLELRPVVWALIALLVVKAVSAPDLADPSGVLYLSLGVLAWHGVQQRRRESLTLQDFEGPQRLRRSRDEAHGPAVSPADR